MSIAWQTQPPFNEYQMTMPNKILTKGVTSDYGSDPPTNRVLQIGNRVYSGDIKRFLIAGLLYTHTQDDTPCRQTVYPHPHPHSLPPPPTPLSGAGIKV